VTLVAPTMFPDRPQCAAETPRNFGNIN